MKQLGAGIVMFLVLLGATPARAQGGVVITPGNGNGGGGGGGCTNSPENPTALLALVGGAGGVFSYVRAGRGTSKGK